MVLIKNRKCNFSVLPQIYSGFFLAKILFPLIAFVLMVTVYKTGSTMLYITSFSVRLQKQYSGKLNDLAKKYLFFIQQGAGRMKTLITDLLDHSEIGKKKLKIIDCNSYVIFQQLCLRSEYGGAGIGLSHRKEIVELHGGKIWMRTKLVKGSSFHFTILENNN